MGLRHSPSIVRSGLVLHLDAANQKSYPGSGTTWFDLSGNGNNGTLINGTSFNASSKCFVFDGTNDYVQFTSTLVKTVCFWGRFETGIPELAGLVCVTATGDGSLRMLSSSFRTGPDINDYQFGYVSQFMINGVTPLSTSGGFYVIPESRTLYQDFYIGANGDRNLSTISHTFMGRVYKGRVYAVCLYDRTLTAAEMRQNFNAFRGRFGI